MNTDKKRNLFLFVIVGLVAVLVLVTAATLLKGPRESSVEFISKINESEIKVNDLYQGEMTIPYYDIPTATYKPDDFTERKGVVTYEGESAVGINVSQKSGEIDWSQVAASGIDYAMIRVGYREYGRGRILTDENFEQNITGAIDAGIPVGVYFYSKAVTDAEAEEEASFVLESIRGYNVTYPVAIYWVYDVKDDGSLNEKSRTKQCNGEQVTGFIDTFCKKVKAAGFTASFYCDKTMGYEKLDLSRLSGYDMWYSEIRTAPSFYYGYTIWQYTKEATVPGIENSVPINLALKKYK